MDFHTAFEFDQTLFDIAGTPIVVNGIIFRKDRTELIVLHPSSMGKEMYIDADHVFLSKQALYNYEIKQEEERHQLLLKRINDRFNESDNH